MQDSNLRRQCHQIYSLTPLTARETPLTGDITQLAGIEHLGTEPTASNRDSTTGRTDPDRCDAHRHGRSVAGPNQTRRMIRRSTEGMGPARPSSPHRWREANAAPTTDDSTVISRRNLLLS